MKIFGDENNALILKELGQRIKDIRISCSMTQKELCEKAGVSFSTVVRIENGEGVNLDNFLRVMRSLKLLQNCNMLIPEQEQTPEQLYKGEKKRKRASKTKKNEQKEWIWGDDKV